MLTLDLLQNSLPQQLKTRVTQDMVDSFNASITDPLVAENMRDNLLSYTRVLADGRFKMADYMDAVRYVSFKLMGYPNQDAYARTFPNRWQALHAQGASPKDISAYVSAYNKNKLVNLILEQTLIPTHVLNQDIYQKAINVQADMMMNAKSEKVRVEAANSLLNHLKRPDTHKVELEIGIKDSSGLRELKDSMAQLAQQQRDMIQGGHISARSVAHSPLVIEAGDDE
ncbi:MULTISPECIES: hypothetical protein [Pantoea]|jgi:hypothetical protein|uniref:Uncharacterized protein n=1 Tax=Pantoea brenneri TaxID=472694 RepID=A0A7Y6NH14_9GAMM|nr:MULTISPECIES: hypothetical protein [Pantoea]MBZ6397043.1 hypothetical protein [Pantoea sp.]MBZ6440206.1 hypothetical protein [Pantoea sp.]NUY43432.1 hypothetical protein [Pantoea brenneri]NUY51002.1 hypothetical protein [Pantoea brenneri]NUY61267.1 hypothetical protein [Pantoea brenneri]